MRVGTDSLWAGQMQVMYYIRTGTAVVPLKPFPMYGGWMASHRKKEIKL